VYGKNIKENNNLGIVDSYASIGKTILDIFKIENDIEGNSLLGNILR
jgi:phosphopentomutase